MKKVLVIHPFLFAIYPILFFYSQNPEYISFSEAWISITILLGFTLLSFLLLTLIIRNVMRAGIMLALFLILFFSYGHVLSLIQILSLIWSGERGHAGLDAISILLIVWMAILVGGFASIIKVKRRLEDLTKILNVSALVLALISLFNIVVSEFRTRTAWQMGSGVEPVQMQRAAPVPVDTLPNIYYIILDGYARADILEEVYNYDNSDFLDFLGQKGFFVANKGQANYAQTALSLASSLNLDYLDDQAARIGLDSKNREPLEQLIKDSNVVRFLKQQGYMLIAFRSGYSATDLKDADIYMGSGQSLNQLEVGLLISTPVPWLLRNQSRFNPYAPRAHAIRYTLDHLADTAQLPAPHFVFAHILGPHPPFVFDEHGNEITWEGQVNWGDGSHFLKTHTIEEYLKGYTAQLSSINDRVEAMLDDLLAQASRPTIIILQADHGPGLLLDWDRPENTYFGERLSILNAYLLPGGGSADLYDEITPVNTFRLIFDRYFGTELELLKDESYFSTWERPYEFIGGTDDVRSGESVLP